jgi:prefoldin beta subunit
MAMRFEDLPAQVQNQLKQLQQYQQQLELFVQQRLQLDARLREIANALDELEKVDDDTLVYKNIGMLIIKADKTTLHKDLKEDRESTELRKKSMEKQEQKLKEKVEELQQKIQDSLKE